MVKKTDIKEGSIIVRGIKGRVKITDVSSNHTFFSGVHLEDIGNREIEGNHYEGVWWVLKDCFKYEGYKLIQPENSIRKLE